VEKVLTRLLNEALKNEEIIKSIAPKGRLRAQQQPIEHDRITRTFWASESLMAVFEALMQGKSKSEKFSEALERLMFNEIKRLTREMDQGQLDAMVKLYLMSREK
jgi:hypothetical protein